MLSYRLPYLSRQKKNTSVLNSIQLVDHILTLQNLTFLTIGLANEIIYSTTKLDF
jgi:hypothetical protein